MDLKNHIGKGIWALTDKGLTGIYGLAVIFLVIAKLPRSEYGMYALALSIVNLALLFNKGFILLPMTKFEAEDNPRPQLLGSTFLMSLAWMGISGLIIAMLGYPLSILFRSPGLAPLLHLAPVILMGFFFRDFSVSFLMGHRKISSIVILDIVYFIGVASSFAVLNAAGKFDRAIMPVLVHTAFSWICSFVAFFIMRKQLKMKFRPKREDIKKISGYGKFSLSMGIGEISFYKLDILLLGYFINPAAVAVYDAARFLFRLYSLLTQSVNMLIFPGTSKLHAEGRFDEIKQLFERVTAYYLSFMFFLNIVLFLGAGLILEIAYSGKYPDSLWILRLFLIFSFFEPLYNISTGVLYGIGKPEKTFKPLVFVVPLFIMMNLVLIPLLAGFGAAISFCTANLLMSTALLRTLNKELNISPVNSLKYIGKIPANFIVLLKNIKRGN